MGAIGTGARASSARLLQRTVGRLRLPRALPHPKPHRLLGGAKSHCYLEWCNVAVVQRVAVFHSDIVFSAIITSKPLPDFAAYSPRLAVLCCQMQWFAHSRARLGAEKMLWVSAGW